MKKIILAFLFIISCSLEKPNGSVVNVPGLKCNSCIKRISQNLNGVEGIRSFVLNKKTKKMSIAFNEKEITLNEIEKLVANAGYHANDTKRTQWAYEKLNKCCKDRGDR